MTIIFFPKIIHYEGPKHFYYVKDLEEISSKYIVFVNLERRAEKKFLSSMDVDQVLSLLCAEGSD